jgi:hypothetical protein
MRPNNNKLTRDIVLDYHQVMTEKVGARLITRQHLDLAIQVLESLDTALGFASSLLPVFKVLDLLGIGDLKDFLTWTAITIPLSDETPVIYVPWNPGDDYPWSKQIEKLAHECEHVVQAKSNPSWLYDYLTDFSTRAREEAKAYHTSAELRYWLYGIAPVAAEYTSDGYLLRPTDKTVFRIGLDALLQPLEHDGAIATETGKFAIDWLERQIK